MDHVGVAECVYALLMNSRLQVSCEAQGRKVMQEKIRASLQSTLWSGIFEQLLNSRCVTGRESSMLLGTMRRQLEQYLSDASNLQRAKAVNGALLKMLFKLSPDF
jgi:transcriptional regulator CtsR